MEKQKLKACPFCGNENLKITKQTYGGLNAWYSIKCKNCKAGISNIFRDLVISSWNKRIEYEKDNTNNHR